ncbi:MAG: hypothetical protein Q4G30_01235 [Actinomycetaceae bacterium]|nr:hypothetical protein [Actinomycetaceae bacterium]
MDQHNQQPVPPRFASGPAVSAQAHTSFREVGEDTPRVTLTAQERRDIERLRAKAEAHTPDASGHTGRTTLPRMLPTVPELMDELAHNVEDHRRMPSIAVQRGIDPSPLQKAGFDWRVVADQAIEALKTGSKRPLPLANDPTSPKIPGLAYVPPLTPREEDDLQDTDISSADIPEGDIDETVALEEEAAIDAAEDFEEIEVDFDAEALDNDFDALVSQDAAPDSTDAPAIEDLPTSEELAEDVEELDDSQETLQALDDSFEEPALGNEEIAEEVRAPLASESQSFEDPSEDEGTVFRGVEDEIVEEFVPEDSPGALDGDRSYETPIDDEPIEEIELEALELPAELPVEVAEDLPDEVPVEEPVEDEMQVQDEADVQDVTDAGVAPPPAPPSSPEDNISWSSEADGVEQQNSQSEDVDLEPKKSFWKRFFGKD